MSAVEFGSAASGLGLLTLIFQGGSYGGSEPKPERLDVCLPLALTWRGHSIPLARHTGPPSMLWPHLPVICLLVGLIGESQEFCPKKIRKKRLPRFMMWHGFPKTAVWVVPIRNQHQNPEEWAVEIRRGLSNASRSPCPAGPAAQPHKIIQHENMQADLPDIPSLPLPRFGYENAQNFTRFSENVPRGSSPELEWASSVSSGKGTEGKGRCVQRGRGRAPTRPAWKAGWLCLWARPARVLACSFMSKGIYSSARFPTHDYL